MKKLFKKIKEFYQIKKYGFKEEDLLELDLKFAEYLLPRIKKLREKTKSYPDNLNSLDDWYKILDKIIEAFELIKISKIYFDPNYSQKQLDQLYVKYTKTVNIGLKFLSKYFCYLRTGD
jgi:hypothetical protein